MPQTCFFQVSHNRNQKEKEFHLFLKTSNSHLTDERFAFKYETFSNNDLIEEILKKGKWAKKSKYTEQTVEKMKRKKLKYLIATNF